jgi:hypothetical protein
LAPLWATFTVDQNPGILDWYAVLTGVMALATLTIVVAASLVGIFY